MADLSDKTIEEYIGLSPEQITERIELTKQWICLMLYTSSKTFDELMQHGCKVMVYGHPYEMFVKILETMVENKTITLATGKYGLKRKGRFNVKRHSIVPILNLIENPEYLSAFIQKNKENCDMQFIGSLQNIRDDEQIEANILQYSEKHYDKLAPILTLVNKFLDNITKGFAGDSSGSSVPPA